MSCQEIILLEIGQLAVLTCNVKGATSVTWTKNGNANIPRAQFRNDGGVLVIRALVPSDKGLYECKASNEFGERRTSTTVIVGGKAYKLL